MDVFDKAYDYNRPEEVMGMGLYPYFRMNETAVDTTTIMNGRKTIMIGSNNYLGLTSHPEVKAAAMAATEKYGTGCTGSRFLNGTIDLHVELEEKLAKFMKKEDALVFSTGFTTNQGVLSTLVQRGDVVISDRTNHASILDGCRLSYGKMIKFKHNDMEDLERVLKSLEKKEVGKLIVVDGVFSMEGDLADLKHIVPLAKKYGARLMVDEAHGLGVLGKRGRGTCEHFGLLDKVDLVMGTFSKSFASMGGFVAGDKKVISYLKHNARAFIFQAAPPPASVAAALKALEILQREPERLTQLRENVSYMLKEIKAAGFRTWPTESAIIPIIVGEDIKTFQFSKMLEEEGVYVNPVISPAVPLGWACLRTSYTAKHTKEELDYALKKIIKVGKALGVIGPEAPGAPVEIIPVSGESKNNEKNNQLQKDFLKLPRFVYQQNPYWVPQLISDVERIFNKEDNVFYKHGDAQAFIAKRGNQVVGRIMAGIDYRANDQLHEKSGFFGFFEIDQDSNAAKALLDSAKAWLQERGMTQMRGPMPFSSIDGMGCLIEGFDQAPAIMMPYNPPYYANFFEQYGLEKKDDLYAFWMSAKESVPARVEKLAKRTQEKEGVRIRGLRPSRLRKELATIMDIFNDANSQDKNYIPLSANDLTFLISKLKPVIEPELVHFIEVKGKPVAFSVILPDYNQVLKKIDGKIGVTNWLKSIFYSKKIDSVRFAMLGVRKAYRRRGLETLLYLESFKAAQALGYTGGELSWVPERDQTVIKAIKSSGGKHTKTYRLYEIKL